MINIFDFIEQCKEGGMTARQAENEYFRAVEEERQAREEAYWEDPYVIDGDRQQDVIDMYRRER